MGKQRAVTLCGSFAIFPLVFGCSTGVGGPPQAYAPPQGYAPQAYAAAPAYAPAPVYAAPSPASAAPADSGGMQVYSVGPGAPAAIVVVLPGAGEAITANPQLWAAQGFDVVTPTPAEIYRMAADEERAMARLIAEAQALAAAPVWLVGPSQAIETAMPQTGGRVSGVIVTSEATPSFSCSESFSYYNPGSGAPPQVKLTRSGNCDAMGMPGITEGEPSVGVPAPAPQPHTSPLIETRGKSLPQIPRRPRIIEASAAGKNLPAAAQVRRLAEMIKAAPPG